MSLFKVVRQNLIHARAVIRQYGKCFLHGDGNIYIKPEDSGFRKDFTNPNADGTPSASSYVLELSSLDQVPTSVKVCEEAFLRAKNKEQRDNANKVKVVGLVSTFSIDESDEEGIDPEENEDTFKPANQGQLQNIPKAEVVKTPKPTKPTAAPKQPAPAPAGKGQTAAATKPVQTSGKPAVNNNIPKAEIVKTPAAEGAGIQLNPDPNIAAKGSAGIEI